MKKRSNIGHLLREQKDEPTRQATFYGEASPDLGDKKRVGRKRNNWIKIGLKEAWKRVRDCIPEGQTESGGKRKYHRRSVIVNQGIKAAADLHLL